MSHRRKLKFKGSVPISLDPFDIELFIQCNNATTCWNRALEGLMTPPASVIPPRSREVPPEALMKGLQIVGALQGMLVAIGCISDIFFPDGKGDAAREMTMRQRFGVIESSPLSHLKPKVRNSFVHIDERIDPWLPSTTESNVGPFAILGKDEAVASASRFLRIVNKEGWRLIAAGEILELVLLLEAVQRVFDKIGLAPSGPDGLPRYTVRSSGINRNWKPVS